MQSTSATPITEFSDTLTRELETQILKAKKPNTKSFAAFDADGTLWDTDVGDIFFLYQIKNCNLPNMPADPWQHYMNLKSQDRVKAYYWLAQISAGQKLSQVHAWAKSALLDFENSHGPLPILKSNLRLIQFLKKTGVDVFVVTASVKWAVEPAAARLGIPPENVLGFHTEVDDGIVTERPIAPPTYRQGKADAVLKASGGVAPIFCAGNTFGDTAMLNCASAVRLAVRTQSTLDTHSPLLEEELILQKEAQEKHWFTHAFRP